MSGLDPKFEEAEAARQLILEIINNNPDGLTSAQIGSELTLTGPSVGQFSIPLVQSGQIIKVPISNNRFLYKPANKADKSAKGSRFILAYKKDPDKEVWTAEIFTTKELANIRADYLSETDPGPGTVVFIGKATDRICAPVPKAVWVKL